VEAVSARPEAFRLRQAVLNFKLVATLLFMSISGCNSVEGFIIEMHRQTLLALQNMIHCSCGALVHFLQEQKPSVSESCCPDHDITHSPSLQPLIDMKVLPHWTLISCGFTLSPHTSREHLTLVSMLQALSKCNTIDIHDPKSLAGIQRSEMYPFCPLCCVLCVDLHVVCTHAKRGQHISCCHKSMQCSIVWKTPHCCAATLLDKVYVILCMQCK
jgi:hypothetical protein